MILEKSVTSAKEMPDNEALDHLYEIQSSFISIAAVVDDFNAKALRKVIRKVQHRNK